MKRTNSITRSTLAALPAVCLSTAAQAADLIAAEARAIAKEAYIYGLPIVDHYRVMYVYAVDRNNPEFKAPFNQTRNIVAYPQRTPHSRFRLYQVHFSAIRHKGRLA
jgi:hypothetical protein